MKKISFITVSAVAFLLMTCVCFVDARAEGGAVVSQTTTLDNLMAAYNGEQNANARYLAFAEKANEEGYDAAASLFRAAAIAEKVHYGRHAEMIMELGGTPKAVIEIPVVRSTPENLESAFKGETYEKDVMYPAFILQAQKEGLKDAIDAFEDAAAAEGVHAELYSRMLKNLTLSKGLAKDFYVCPVCGNVVDAIIGSKCPICFADTKKFMKVK